MGWTSYHANYYKSNGAIDRKAECDAYFMEGANRRHYRVLKSAMVGSVYYAAVQDLLRYTGKDEDGSPIYVEIPDIERETWAAVFLTKTDARDYYNFYYKDMSEDMGPAEASCPASILRLLSPTDSEWANEWREKCRKHIERKKSPNALSNLPIGTVIRFVTYNGETVELLKHPAAYQFKRPFWYCQETGRYMPATRIPDNYKVVTA